MRNGICNLNVYSSFILPFQKVDKSKICENLFFLNIGFYFFFKRITRRMHTLALPFFSGSMFKMTDNLSHPNCRLPIILLPLHHLDGDIWAHCYCLILRSLVLLVIMRSKGQNGLLCRPILGQSTLTFTGSSLGDLGCCKGDWMLY